MRTPSAKNLVLFLVLTAINVSPLLAQSGTTSAISGTVTDASGAVVVNASVTATEVDTKATRTGQTDSGGHYLFSQVNPGTYRVTVRLAGFASAESEPTPVGVGRNVALNFTLQVNATSQTVEVTAQQGLLTLDNPNTTTTIEAKTIENLPNPGQDLTYVTQFAQGALMNTAGSSSDAKAAGGYGNVEFNGLPATSNGYILDGYDSNDPWLGENIGLSTNLVIGLDALQEATVNTNSYSVDQGRYGASQVNYFTKSGTNAFHGDAYELWNGSLLNAEDYFLHANDTPGNIAQKPRSVVNMFGVSVGGPIRRNKLFFFAHYEGVRLALPIVTSTTLPTPAYQQYVLGQLAVGGTDPVTGTNLPAQPAEIPFYQNMFSLLPPPGGSTVQITGCPLYVSVTPPVNGALPDGDGCATQQQRSLGNSDTEDLIVVKIDHTINTKDSVWYRFQRDTGLQAEWTDPIDSIFNSYSPQPQYTLVAGYTHLFGSSLVNQFNPGASWYSSIFEPNNYAQALQTFPIMLASGSDSVPFTTIGGLNDTFPQGRKVTQWQINDNLTWTRGRHTLHFGINTRRVDTSDYDLGEGIVPTVTYNDLAEFTHGAAYTAQQNFPVSLKDRVAVGNLEYYGMDTYKPTPKATLTYGMRVTWNTNVTSPQGLFGRMAGSFLDASHETNQPLNQVILGNVHNLFAATPLFIYQPRASIAYQLLPHTAVHTGFGVFNDIVPQQIADNGLINAPNDPSFTGGIAGPAGDGLAVGIAPGVSGSAVDAAASANTLFQAAFNSGGAPCAGIQPGAPTCPLAVSLNTFPTGTLKTPYYYQYNLGIEQQIGSRGDLRADYVGTRGLHEPYQVQLNGYQNVCDGCFAPFPYQRPLDQRFANVTEFQTGASSNYNGLQTAYTQQWGGLTLRANYTFSHCLDEVSNGGLLAFSTQGLGSPLPGELRRQYASCDYDVRHNISAYGMYQVPFRSSHPFLRQVLGGWSFSETGFLHSGLPFSVLSQQYSAQVPSYPYQACDPANPPSCQQGGVFQASNPAQTIQFAVPNYANRVPGVPLYRKTPYPGVTVDGTKQWLNPDAFVSVVDPTTGACFNGTLGDSSSATDNPAICQFGDSGRNSVRGPYFTYSDMYITKTFPIRAGIKLRIDGQMFNAFNHPNFALPETVEAGVPGSVPARFGTLQSVTMPPTGLLGVGLGGDSSPRMIAFQGRIEF